MASLSPQISSVLALDTASPFPAVSLLRDGVASSERLSSDRRASEELLPAIERLFAQTGARLRDCDRIAVCSGPGSFTGLRIGLATAWGLSRGSGVEVEPVPTLEAMAEAARDSAVEQVAAALDAGRGEIVLELYGLTGARAEPLSPVRRLPRDEAREQCRGLALVSLPQDLLGIPALSLPVPLSEILARAVARAPRLAASPLESAAVYSRRSAAEEKHGTA
ncbi:MAG TPA: tRNA (adenosine(37)-N6)-threonylcarbamoyltransferase complex dimerization subunit type 1 TsaB [Thermoanaerobaculia bacterium]